MPRSFGRTLLPTRPPVVTIPPEIPSSPAIMRSTVDLPQPDGPTSTQNSPSSPSTSTPCTPSVEPKDLRPPVKVTAALLALRFQTPTLAFFYLVIHRGCTACSNRSPIPCRPREFGPPR